MAVGKGKGIQIVVGTDYNDRDLKRAQRDLDRLKSQAAATMTPMQKLGSTMRGMVGPAFAMAGVAVAGFAVKLAVDGVKAAMDEEAALVKLEQALSNVGQAFALDSVNTFIDDMQFATGVADDELRPAFQRLVTATRDVARAQDLLNLALDISVGTGKSLESVSLALAKAATGQASALRRLGVPLSDAAIKSGDLNAVVTELNDSFGGQAAAAADTFAGKMNRIKIAADELTESFGVGFLSAFSGSGSGADDLATSIRDLQPFMELLGKSIGELVVATGDLAGRIKYLADEMNVPRGPDWLNELLGYMLGLPGLVKAAAAALGLFTGDMDRGERSAAQLADEFERSGKAAGIMAQLVGEQAAPATYQLGDNAASATDAMSLLRSEIRRTTVRLGFLASAFDDANAAMDRRESMRSYKEALQTFVADPSAETRDAAVAAMTDVATGFDDPTEQAKFTAGAVQEITNAAKAAGVSVPTDLANIGTAARNQLDPIAALKREMELIPRNIPVTITISTTGGKPPGVTWQEWWGNGATGGPVGSHNIRKGMSRGVDSVPMLLAPGEFVIRSSAVDKFGAGLFSQLNRGINPLAGMSPTGSGRAGGFSIGTINVTSVAGERAETSLPRALRRMAFLAGVNG